MKLLLALAMAFFFLPAECGAAGKPDTLPFLVDPPSSRWVKRFPLCKGHDGPGALRQEINDNAVLLTEPYSFMAKEDLSPAEVAWDIAVLEYTLKHGYIGSKYLDRAGFENAIKRLQELGRNTTSSSSRDLCDNIANILWDLPDAHLGVWHWGAAGCGTTSLWPQYGSVGDNVANQREIPWEIHWVRSGGDKIPLVAISGFPPHDDVVWTGFLDSFRQAISSAPAVIFDLRGNVGGDSQTAVDLAYILYGGSFPFPEETKRIAQTPAAYILQANYYKMMIISAQQHGKTPDPAVTDMFDRSMGEAAAAKPDGESVYSFPAQNIDPAALWKHPIYLLTDRRCGSSGESMVGYLEAHPYATTVGDNTLGSVQFGDVGWLALPNSRVMLQLSTTFKTFKDERVLEKSGYAPKIRVPYGEDALKYALEDLKLRLSLP